MVACETDSAAAGRVSGEQQVACLGLLQCSRQRLLRQVSQGGPPRAALLLLWEQQQALALCAAAQGEGPGSSVLWQDVCHAGRHVACQRFLEGAAVRQPGTFRCDCRNEHPAQPAPP